MPPTNGGEVGQPENATGVLIVQSLIRLSDDEIDALHRAAAPLPLNLRAEFLQRCAERLRGQSEIGPGNVFRIGREVQRELFDPPRLDTGTIKHGKYDV
jgi:hypothetical protein